MRGIRAITVGLTATAAVLVFGCGGHDTRAPAKAPSAKTGTSQAALTTQSVSTTTTTGADVGSTSMGTNATVAAPVMPVTPPVGVASAVMRVTLARCDREVACNHVGTGRAFGDRDACVNEVGHDVVGVLSTGDCPGGVDADRLAACESELKASSCDGEATAIERVATCGRDRLCKPSL